MKKQTTPTKDKDAESAIAPSGPALITNVVLLVTLTTDWPAVNAGLIMFIPVEIPLVLLTFKVVPELPLAV